MNPDHTQPQSILGLAYEMFANDPELLEQEITTETTPSGSQVFWILDNSNEIEVFNLTNNIKNNFTGMHLEVNIPDEQDNENMNLRKIQALNSNKRGILKLLVNLDNGFDFNIQDSIKSNPSTNLLKKRNEIFMERFGNKYEITIDNGMNTKLKSEGEDNDAKYARFRQYLLDQLSVINDMIEDYRSRSD